MGTGEGLARTARAQVVDGNVDGLRNRRKRAREQPVCRFAALFHDGPCRIPGKLRQRRDFQKCARHATVNRGQERVADQRFLVGQPRGQFIAQPVEYHAEEAVVGHFARQRLQDGVALGLAPGECV